MIERLRGSGWNPDAAQQILKPRFVPEIVERMFGVDEREPRPLACVRALEGIERVAALAEAHIHTGQIEGVIRE